MPVLVSKNDMMLRRSIQKSVLEGDHTTMSHTRLYDSTYQGSLNNAMSPKKTNIHIDFDKASPPDRKE
jgi:hypothetical protein